MLTLSGSHTGLGSQAQSGISLEHAQSLTAQGISQAWHCMPALQSASVVQCAGVHAFSTVVSHGSGAGTSQPG